MKPIKNQWLKGAIRLTAITSIYTMGLFGAWATAALAQDAFGNEVVQFSEETVVEFEFIESHGAYQSSLGVKNLDTGEEAVLFQEVKPYDTYGTGAPQPSSPGQNNTGTNIDFVGTVDGGSVSSKTAEYTFKANTRYAFYLESVSPTGQTRRSVLSTNSLGALFDGSLDAGNRNGVVGSRIAWDDDGLPKPGKDQDFDDFIIEAGGYLVTVTCPPVE